MGKIVITEFLSLDGVMEDPGGSVKPPDRALGERPEVEVVGRPIEMSPEEPYLPPNWMQSHVGNRLASLFGRRFVSRLTVRGRRSGEPRTVPVAVLDHEGVSYLIAPRGRTHWVRNLRAAGKGELRHRGRTRRFRAEEVPVPERPPLIAAYRREFDRFPSVAATFEQLPDPADHPTFRLTEKE